MFDVSTATPVSSVSTRTRGQNYDMRYSEKTGNFTVANSTWSRLNLDQKGFVVVRDANNNVAFQIVKDDDAQFLGARYRKESGEKMNKGKTFTGRLLRPMLDEAGLEGVNKFEFSKVDTGDDRVIYEVVARDESNTDGDDDFDAEEAEEAQEEAQETAEEAQETQEEEAPASDPFADDAGEVEASDPFSA